MTEGIQQRCKRICNGEANQCFINNKKQLSCLSDMLINNVYSITSMLEFAMDEQQREDILENINEALTLSRNLINWVKYLQITHDIHQLEPVFCEPSRPDLRVEQRYVLPEQYHEYIELTLDIDDQEVPATLVNFSRSGLQFKAPVEFNSRIPVQCILRTKHLVGKRVDFTAKPCYILVDGEEYITGAQVLEVSNRNDFDFFRSVHGFIKDITPITRTHPAERNLRYEQGTV